MVAATTQKQNTLVRYYWVILEIFCLFLFIGSKHWCEKDFITVFKVTFILFILSISEVWRVNENDQHSHYIIWYQNYIYKRKFSNQNLVKSASIKQQTTLSTHDSILIINPNSIPGPSPTCCQLAEFNLPKHMVIYCQHLKKWSIFNQFQQK